MWFPRLLVGVLLPHLGRALPASTSLAGVLTAAPTSTATATGGKLPPTCGVERCLPSGMFYGCTPSNFPCICTKERRFIDEYINTISSCVADQRRCTPGGLYTFMQAFQDICAHVGNPITSLPSEIGTWLMTSLWTATPTSFGIMLSSTMAGVGTTSGGISASPTLSTSSVALPESDQLNAGEAGLSRSAKIGLGVGLAAAGLFVIGAIVFGVRRRARKRVVEVKGETESANVKPGVRESVGISELEGETVVGNGLGARQSVLSELDGNTMMDRLSGEPVEMRGSVLSELEGDTGMMGTGHR